MKKSRTLAAILLAILATSIAVPVFSEPLESPAPSPAKEARALAVGIDSIGQLWAVWEVDIGTDVELYFSRQVEGIWSTPLPVHSRPSAWDRFPSLAVAADGAVWLAWSSSEMTDPDRTSLYVSRWASHRWTDPVAVPLGGISVATESSLAVAPDSSLWLAWVGFDGVDEEIFASHSDGKSWAFPQQVSADDHDPFLYDKQPRLAVGEDGQPWLVWTGHQSGVDDEIYASRWTGTTWTPEQMVSQDDDALDVWPSLVLDAQDRPWVAWNGRVSEGEYSRRRILVSRWDPSSATWAAEEIASSPLWLAVDEEHPTLSLDATGRVYVAWIASGSSDSALGYAWHRGDQWSEPQLARAGVSTEIAHSVPGAGDAPRFLWIDAAADPTMPVEWQTSPWGAEPIKAWAEEQADPEAVLVDPVWNRHLAFGDSITWGQYNDFYPYPARLEDKLDAKVVPSEVINSGVPGERTGLGRDRIGNTMGTYRPQFVIIMEGTNDVTHAIPPSEVQENLMLMVDIVRRHSGVSYVKVMLGTLIPRKDSLNGATKTMNEQAIAPAASTKRVPLCDPWQAFYDYGPWQSLYYDFLHPNGTGLQLLADTFYACTLDFYWWMEEDTTPPTATLDPVPAQTQCHLGVPLSWSGSDGDFGTGVANYDVQVKIGSNNWTDWLAATPSTSASYTDLSFGQTLGFRVRARDVAGNVGAFTAAQFTEVVDTIPPYDVYVRPIGTALTPPFTVHWNGRDHCADVAAYQVQYRIGLNGAWQNWLSSTPSTSGIFSPASPQYGETYYFQVRARDQANNWSGWSEPVSTILARYTLRGHVFTVRHEPVAAAEVVINGAVAIEPTLGGYVAYVVEAGDYDVSVSRYGFGNLPPMKAVPVAADVGGLISVLPSHDDAVTNGGFEAGLTGWQADGTATPSPSSLAHTGDGAAQLGDEVGTSSLSQTLTPGSALTSPTLSFLARLDQAGPASTLSIELESASERIALVSFALTVESDEWTHYWYDLEGMVSDPLTLTFTVSNDPPIILDEVSIGSAIQGSYRQWMPLVWTH
jgi:lysophospholipase L1-like esterase